MCTTKKAVVIFLSWLVFHPKMAHFFGFYQKCVWLGSYQVSYPMYPNVILSNTTKRRTSTARGVLIG